MRKGDLVVVVEALSRFPDPPGLVSNHPRTEASESGISYVKDVEPGANLDGKRFGFKVCHFANRVPGDPGERRTFGLIHRTHRGANRNLYRPMPWPPPTEDGGTRHHSSSASTMPLLRSSRNAKDLLSLCPCEPSGNRPRAGCW